MRQIGTLSSEQQARRFSDYLLTRGVSGVVDQAADSHWAVWVHDEDQVETAKQEFASFLLNPDDSSYAEATPSAERLRRKGRKAVELSQNREAEARRQLQRPSLAKCRVTMALIAVSVGVAAVQELSSQPDQIRSALSIASYDVVGTWMRWDGLIDLQHGQIWRLVTPIFLHASLTSMNGIGFIHLLFNMMWLRSLGPAVEFKRGAWRFLLIVLTIAVTSNLAQYGVNRWLEDGGPNFGGMSGVVFGLFGYIWMKSRFDPNAGFYMPGNLIFFMIAWLFLCITGAVGSIANTCHAVGMASGMALGYLPSLWIKARR